MKAIYLDKKPDVDSLILGEISKPSAKPGEVLVKVHATAVTPTELEWYPTVHQPSGEPRPFPIVLSHEFSGVIDSVGGEVKGWNVGDMVYGLNDWFSNGAQAEYCLAAANTVAAKPKVLDHPHAAVVPISALTAWQGLFHKTRLEPGERVLIHGSAGGVGTFAVQLACWRGAHVIATASSGNLDFVRSLGANEVIDYQATRFEGAVQDIDVVFDAVGGETLERSWQVLAKKGRLVSVAAQSEGSVDPRVKEAFMLVQADGSQLAEIGNLIDTGKLRVFVEDVFPFARAREAYARAMRGKKRGKIALKVME